MAGVIAKNIVRGTPKHGYTVLPAFSYIFNNLNPRSINSLMVDEESGKFIYYFMAFGASIRGYPHIRKVVAIDALHLKNRNEYGTSIYNYSSQIYSNESYLLAYLEPICAAPLEWEWSVVREYLEMQVLPPGFDPKLGRRKVKRVKSVLEPSRYKKRNKCSKCKRQGHKRTICSLNVG
ncbi:hypothetical protein BC332_17189 [Capsicum chinense]|nr:hypothetical protein BC332_17189 [Capsicum chinense]